MSSSRSQAKIVDSTLREGEQFGGAAFTTKERLEIAASLDAFGVDYIEMTSPAASPRAEQDLKRIVAQGFRAKILTHTRCHQHDIEKALACGVDGVNLIFGTSSWLREHSHGRSIERIIEEARVSVQFLQRRGIETRFSCEDAFRTPLEEVLRICRAIAEAGADRIGLADTVGKASPMEVHRVVSAVRKAVDCDIEFHGHNDGGCAVANTFTAFEAGATHLDVTILGIGERNGICSLGGLIARWALSAPEQLSGYRPESIPALDRMLAQMIDLPIPHDACISSPYAFTHKAGLHTKAVLGNPECYESLNPASFGRERSVLTAHSLVGKHAVLARAKELGVDLNQRALLEVVADIKTRADMGDLMEGDIDQIVENRQVKAARAAEGNL